MNPVIKAVLRPPYHLAKRILRLFEPRPIGYILMLHRVDDVQRNKGLGPNDGLMISPQKLQEVIDLFRAKDFAFIALADVPGYAARREKRRFVAFTLDDGYKDNYTQAYPVFRKNSVPFTIFVATDYPEKKALLWWYEVETLLTEHDALTVFIDGHETVLDCPDAARKDKAFSVLRTAILRLPQETLRDGLNGMFRNYTVDWSRRCDELCMDWGMISELNGEPLATIGAHTAHHVNLHRLESEAAIKSEVEEGLRLLKENAGVTATVFAYPYGSAEEVAEREITALSATGIEVACLAYGGGYKRKNRNAHALPRLSVGMDFLEEKLR